MVSSGVTIVQWIVDTRDLWPEAKQTKQLESHPIASRALALLPPADSAAVLKYYFARDARMSLASHLLKRYAISRCCAVPWAAANISRDPNGKPVFVAPPSSAAGGGGGSTTTTTMQPAPSASASASSPLSFNVSHQAGMVALAGVHGYDAVADVGVDVVSPAERSKRDRDQVRTEGWATFVDVHADVFGRGEAEYLKRRDGGDVLRSMPRRWTDFAEGEAEADGAVVGGSGSRDGTAALDYKLRAFYALWCYREAYVKMTGEALMAEWLADLQFVGFRPPMPWMEGRERQLQEEGEADGEGEEDGPLLKAIMFKGRRVDDVNVDMRTMGDDFMICTMVRTPDRKEDGLGFKLGPYTPVTIDEIIEYAEAS